VAGPSYVFRVQNGRVIFDRSGVQRLRDGMPVEEFLAALQALRSSAP
jgi:hypothetical protein